MRRRQACCCLPNPTAHAGMEGVEGAPCLEELAGGPGSVIPGDLPGLRLPRLH